MLPKFLWKQDEWQEGHFQLWRIFLQFFSEKFFFFFRFTSNFFVILCFLSKIRKNLNDSCETLIPSVQLSIKELALFIDSWLQSSRTCKVRSSVNPLNSCLSDFDIEKKHLKNKKKNYKEKSQRENWEILEKSTSHTNQKNICVYIFFLWGCGTLSFFFQFKTVISLFLD